ncbi:MAG: hypothetical protein IPN74_04730 [Haliscomenobacter sp.]|nr:hypothetical protein [Haliscomenobacter sp.]MBK8877858.1 hypothetical protein [Haliscomenobacter sp.]
MKHIWFTLVFIVLASAGLSAQGNMESRIRSMRVAFITERMKLSPDEAEKFWPIHNQYESETRKIREKYRAERDFQTMSDQEVERFLTDHLDMEDELLKLKRDYYARMRKVVPARKLAMYVRADLDFNRKLIQSLQNRK